MNPTIVVYTNVFISAILGRGASREVIRARLAGQLHPLMGEGLYRIREAAGTRHSLREIDLDTRREGGPPQRFPLRLRMLFDELSTVALVQHDIETRFQSRAACGSAEEGLSILDKLDAAEEENL